MITIKNIAKILNANSHEILLRLAKSNVVKAIVPQPTISNSNCTWTPDVTDIPLSEHFILNIAVTGSWQGKQITIKDSNGISYVNFKNDITLSSEYLFINEEDLSESLNLLNDLRNTTSNVDVVNKNCSDCIIIEIMNMDINKASGKLIKSNYLLMGILLDFILGHLKKKNPETQEKIAEIIVEEYYENGLKGKGLSERSIDEKFKEGNKLKNKINDMFEEARKQNERAIKNLISEEE